MEIPDVAARQGLRDVRWPGRFQFVNERIVLDGCHNPHAAEQLLVAWRDHFGMEKATLIWSTQRQRLRRNPEDPRTNQPGSFSRADSQQAIGGSAGACRRMCYSTSNLQIGEGSAGRSAGQDPCYRLPVLGRRVLSLWRLSWNSPLISSRLNEAWEICRRIAQSCHLPGSRGFTKLDIAANYCRAQFLWWTVNLRSTKSTSRFRREHVGRTSLRFRAPNRYDSRCSYCDTEYAFSKVRRGAR